MAIYDINDRNFDYTIRSQVPVLIDFWGDDCIPCKMMEPILNGLQSTLSGKIAVKKANIKNCPKVVERYNVMSLPTLILFKKGKQVEKIVGVLKEPVLRRTIEANL